MQIGLIGHWSRCLLMGMLLYSWPVVADQWTDARQQALNRPRRIIFNNDGNEPVKDCKVASPEELLKYRTTPLAGTQVDSLFYCTWSSGFGLFTHFTKVGQVFTSREGRFTNNLMPEFLSKGVDPLSVMVNWAHAQKKELFWSFRVNDTHDGTRTDYGPVMFRTNSLKLAHPEWLIGSADKRPKYGVWSAVDYGVPQIRDLAFRYCEEVCRNYDVDGIELDFFRHAFFFKCSGQGTACGNTELDQMTALIRRIRAMAEAAGRARQRPILLAIRVPDSVEYSNFIGLDWERWLKEGLVDLLVVGGYTQFNHWDYSVKLGHRYGAKVYPSLDESRVKDESALALRRTSATYRGRALNATAAGADGVYLFNFFDPNNELWNQLGDPGIMHTLERNYFASIRGVSGMPVPHQKYIKVATLNPSSPISFSAKKAAKVEFFVGEDFTKSDNSGVTLNLLLRNAAPEGGYIARLNGRLLPLARPNGDWLHYGKVAEQLRKGVNAFEIKSPRGSESEGALLDLYVQVQPSK